MNLPWKPILAVSQKAFITQGFKEGNELGFFV
jgi:hypothetical protein